MTRVLIGAVVGAVLLFVWNFASWMLLKLHDDSLRPMSGEPQVVSMLKQVDLESGAYFFPYIDPAAPTEEQDAAMERHRKGPIGFLVYHAEGKEPMPPTMFLVGFGLYFGATLIAALLLASAQLANPVGRALFVAGVGVVIGLMGPLSNWTWMHFPTDFATSMVIDNVVGWAIVGIALAAIIRPSASAVTT